MESMQSIKKRARGITNIQKITKAMEMVSAQKMRQSQEIALASRPYALRGLELLSELSRRITNHIPLIEARPVKKTLVLLVAADKGLAGSFNGNVFRKFEEVFGKKVQLSHSSYGDLLFSSIGKKAQDFLRRKGIRSLQSFIGFGDYAGIYEVEPLSKFLIAGYEAGKWDKVLTFSAHFRSTLKQEVLVREILPASFESIEKTVKELVPEHGRYADMKNNNFKWHEHPYFEYLVEPSPENVLQELIKHLVAMVIYHLVLEANASEHSARMVAMKNASDNAGELIGTLTLRYNKARQAGITKELAEITGGAEALKI